MRIRTLGRTGLRVSEICLGAMTFGMPEWGCDERESLALIDRFLEAGGNFIDTADAYSGTISEEICGQALAGRRTQIVLATKVTMPVGSGPNDRGASRKHIRESCDASLRRLKTDYIDLYQIHAEDLWTPLYRFYFNERAFGIVDVLIAAAREADCTPAQLALAWQLAKPEITSVIIGARNQAQLADNLGATAVTVPPEIMDRLETASRIEPEYPGAFIDFIQGWLGNR